MKPVEQRLHVGDAPSDVVIEQADINLEWAESLPLRRELPPCEPYPLEALGSLLFNAAQTACDVIQAPTAIVGQSFLAAATLAVQGHADVGIDGRIIPASDFFSTVGESGERKSSTDKAALAPHRQREKQLREEWNVKQSNHVNDLAAWKKSREEALGAKNKTPEAKRKALESLGAEPPAPIEPLLLTTEPTLEGLTRALAFGWPSMGLFSDEGGQFLGGHAMNPDNIAKSATTLSVMWGGDPIRRLRISDSNMVLYGRRVALHLMFQPIITPMLFGNDLLNGQGFTSRILTTWPASNIGNHRYRDVNLSGTPEMRAYFDHMMHLLEKPLPIREGTQNELDPRYLAIAPDAKKLYVGFHDHVSALCADGRELHGVRAFASKAAEHALRLAAILSLTDNIDMGILDANAMRAGIELVQFYIGEAIRIFNISAENPNLVLAEKVLTWARLRGGRFAVQTLYQHGPNAVRTKEAAMRILKLLADHGQARALPAGTVVDGKKRLNAWEVRSA